MMNLPCERTALWSTSAKCTAAKSLNRCEVVWTVNLSDTFSYLERQGQRKGIGDPNKLFCTLNYYKLEEYFTQKLQFAKKNNIYSRYRWVCFFIGADLDEFSILSLAHQWILCSEWVPSEWESNSCVFVRRKSTIWCYNFELHHLWWKYHYP